MKVYEGGDIVLDKDSNVVLSPADFPELCEYKGQDLIVTDGKTLLGAEFTTQFTVSALYNIINSRELEGKPTIISTNLTPEQLTSTYSERIASRILSNFVMLYFDGSDIRQIKTR